MPPGWQPNDLQGLRAWAADNLRRAPRAPTAAGFRSIVSTIDDGSLLASLAGPTSTSYTGSVDVRLLPTSSDQDRVDQDRVDQDRVDQDRVDRDLDDVVRAQLALRTRLVGRPTDLSRTAWPSPLGRGIRIEATRAERGSTPARIIDFIVRYGSGYLDVSGAAPASDGEFPQVFDQLVSHLRG